MTTQQQAYINGFIKRAAEYGFSEQEAAAILKYSEELKGDQHKLDVDHDGEIEAEDLKKLRAQKNSKIALDQAPINTGTVSGGVAKPKPPPNIVNPDWKQQFKNLFTLPPRAGTYNPQYQK
jgi:hypothetical protein